MNTNQETAVQETACERNSSAFIKGAIIGGLVGAAAALLLAPKSGRELRTDLACGAQNVTEKTKEVALDLSSKAATAVKNAGEKAETVVSGVKEASATIATSVKDATTDAAQQVREATLSAVQSVKDASADIKESVAEELKKED
ncbi:YtxH domain-containing protein [Paenibacillus sp. 1001270B_150601_E10]|uniref:YtxH domain-containing protein n=1 Tax=Paenibacillus sp. 1001270B_150601_E10 TaxID=2787079 RepID=UPI0018A01B38|nr:YtxH domain-containing protein [Paenibacillus sp. 1001270B_150601_E10]